MLATVHSAALYISPFYFNPPTKKPDEDKDYSLKKHEKPQLDEQKKKKIRKYN